SGSPVITVASYSGLWVGQTVVSSYFAAGTKIIACGGGAACSQANVTLSSNATFTTVGEVLTTYPTITACGGGTVCTTNPVTLSSNATATAVGTALKVSST